MYVIKNEDGLEARVTELGASLMALYAPDREGVPGNIVLGYDTLASYIQDSAYVGSSIGRYANRIAGGTFTLSGHRYRLSQNEGRNHLHGGFSGFNKALWISASDSSDAVSFRYTSRDGEEGYPGNLTVGVKYTLTDKNELRIDYLAVSDRETIVNLTNHSYFNLRGSGNILQHELRVAASNFTPVDQDLIPTGELRTVELTPFDFRKPTAIGDRIDENDQQLKVAGGYDHNWVLDGGNPGHFRLAAHLHDPMSGRNLEILTLEPGIQIYSANRLKPNFSDERGQRFGRHSGLCLEPQHFPDSPNRPQFPTVTVGEGVEYRSTTIYKLSAS
jgi:aldose 1-epimerase